MKPSSIVTMLDFPIEFVDLQQQRQRLLNILLLGAFFISLVIYPLALVPALRRDLVPVAVIYTVVFLWLGAITFFRRIPYPFRSGSWLFFLYVFGVINLGLSGLNVDAGLFFVTFIATTTFLFDIRWSLLSFVVSLLSIALAGFLVVGGHLPLQLGLPQSDHMLWIIGGLLFFFLGFSMIGSVATLLRGLEASLKNVVKTTEVLQEKNNALIESEERYRSLIETSPDAILMLDLQNDIRMINPAGLTVIGVKTLEELNVKRISEIFQEGSQQKLVEALEATRLEGGVRDVEATVKREDGSLVDIEFSTSLLNDAAGNPIGILCIGKDISERKHTQRFLQEAKESLEQQVKERTEDLLRTSERLNQLLTFSPVILYTAKALESNSITWVSDNLSELSWHLSHLMMSDPEIWQKWIHPEDLPGFLQAKKDVLRTGKASCEFRVRGQDGRDLWVHDESRLSRNRDGKPIEIIGSWLDITDRVRSELELKHSEEKYRSLFDGMLDGFVSVRMDGAIVDFNEAYREMLGYDAQELQQLTYVDLTPEKWHAFETRIVETQILPRGYSEVYEKEYRKKDGTIFPVELRTILSVDQEDNPAGMWAIVRDFSERKELETQVRESEERYRILAESSQDIITILDRSKIVHYLNTFAADLVGSPLSKVTGQPIEALLEFDQIDQLEQAVFQVVKTGKKVRFESKVKVKKKTIWLDVYLVPLREQGSQVDSILMIARDITKRIRAEIELKRFSQELEERVVERTAQLESSQTQLRDLTQSIIHSRESENRLFSRELHDSAGQKLITIRHAILNHPQIRGQEQDENQARSADLLRIVDETIELIRSISHRMRPPVLEIGGVNISIEELCRECAEQTQVEIDYRGSDLPGLPDDIGISLYRVVQEALSNILKHAQASMTKVRLSYDAGIIKLSIQDNGVGFPDSSSYHGIGLLGIEERLRVLGGSLEISRRVKNGTKLIALVPWQAGEFEPQTV